MEKSKKYPIHKEFNSLNFIENLAKNYELYLTANFEVEPFTKWSTEFASEYWFLKYHLLLNGEIKIENKDYDLEFLFQESNLNIIWLTLTDKKNFELKCIDGSWILEILNSDFDKVQDLLRI